MMGLVVVCVLDSRHPRGLARHMSRLPQSRGRIVFTTVSARIARSNPIAPIAECGGPIRPADVGKRENVARELRARPWSRCRRLDASPTWPLLDTVFSQKNALFLNSSKLIAAFRLLQAQKVFGNTFQQVHQLWRGNHYQWLPDSVEIPKNLGERVPEDVLATVKVIAFFSFY